MCKIMRARATIDQVHFVGKNLYNKFVRDHV